MQKQTYVGLQHTLWRRKTLKVAKQITSKQNWKISAEVNAHQMHNSFMFSNRSAALQLQMNMCMVQNQ